MKNGKKKKKKRSPRLEMIIIDEKGKSHKATPQERYAYFKKKDRERM